MGRSAGQGVNCDARLGADAMNRRRFLDLSVSTSAALIAGACRHTAIPSTTRGRNGLPKDAFDAKEIPTYRGNHSAAYRYIDDHIADHLGHIRRWVRQPSVAAEGRGITEMATMVVQDLKSLGFH